MKKLIIALVILVIVGIGTYYLVFNNNPGGTPTASNTYTNTPVLTATIETQTPTLSPATGMLTTTPKTSVSKTPTPASVTVSIANFAFNPSTLTIKKGTKVTWVNNDGAPHTVTSDSGNLLNSSTISPGQSFSFTFSNTGSVNYHCSIHPTMKGNIVISN